jgi:hypothetical protein
MMSFEEHISVEPIAEKGGYSGQTREAQIISKTDVLYGLSSMRGSFGSSKFSGEVLVQYYMVAK